MTKSTYDLCLLFINQNDFLSDVFDLIKMQTNETLMLKDNQFAELKEKELKEAKLMSKKQEMLINVISIKFNDEIISLIEVIKNSYSLSLTQPKQFDQIQLINISVSFDLIDSRDQIRKRMTSKDQYVTQRARIAYIVTMT